MSEDEDYTYFFVVDASIGSIMIERNPGPNYLPFFPRRVNEKDITKSEFMKNQSEKHKIQAVFGMAFDIPGMDKNSRLGNF